MFYSFNSHDTYWLYHYYFVNRYYTELKDYGIHLCRNINVRQNKTNKSGKNCLKLWVPHHLLRAFLGAIIFSQLISWSPTSPLQYGNLNFLPHLPKPHKFSSPPINLVRGSHASYPNLHIFQEFWKKTRHPMIIFFRRCQKIKVTNGSLKWKHVNNEWKKPKQPRRIENK